MKDKDTIENILTDNTNLDMETLEKINDTCCALSDKQKDRILDIIEQKTINKEQTKDIIHTTESEDSVKIITYRRNHMKLIISAVACICLLVGTGLFGKLSDNNITQKKNPKETSNTSVSTTTITNTTSKYVTTIKPESAVTTPSVSTLPPVTVIETVSETTTTTSGVTTTTAPPETTVSETSAISNTTAKELKNLKDYFLGEKIDYSDNPITQKLTDAGLNEEQIYKIMRSEIFTKFADRIPIDYSKENNLGNSERLTGYSYSSYCDLINYFFTGNGSKAVDIWKAGNVDGELKMIFASPVRAGYDNVYVEVLESSDSYLKIIIDMEEIYTLSDLINKGLVSEEEIENTDDISKLLNEKDNIKNYYGNYLSEIEIKSDNDIGLHFRYTEEMVKTDEGWKFDLYQDFRKR